MDDEALFEELRRFPQDSQIRVALAGKNFKKAIQLIDKRTKNADKSTSFLTALKALVLSRMPLVADKSSALLLIEEALDDKSLVADLDDVELYDHAFEQILTQQRWASTIGELRWQFVKSNPKQENASIDCFKACLLKGDLEHAIKIATSLDSTFPAKHEYVFWRITTTFMYSKATKDIWGRLSLALIGKLAETTKKSGVAGVSLPAQSIQKPQELLLLQLIEQSHGTTQQRLNYLGDPHLGPESAVAKEEWQLWIDKLELMEAQAQWQELFETTGSLLRRARTKNAAGNLGESRYSDMIVWTGFKKSAEKLGHINKILSELEGHLDPNSGIDKPWRRNAAIIQLELRFNNAIYTREAEPARGTLEESLYEDKQLLGRPAVIIEYLQRYGDTTVAYEDIRPHAESLALEDRTKLLEILLRNDLEEKDNLEGSQSSDIDLSPQHQNVTSSGKITKLVNVYKLIYLLTSCIPEFERGTSPASECICSVCTKPSSTFCSVCLSRLAKSAMESYFKATENDDEIAATLLSTDRHPADDLCILSAMCLVKLSISTSGASHTLHSVATSNWMRAALLLEYAWSNSKPNFQISLLLVKLYSLLGCGSMAMRAYQRLGVKQIQYDTLSHTIFDRISTFHPHPFGHIPDSSSELRSPLNQLNDQQEMYKKAGAQINKNLWKSFQLGSYSSALQFTEFSEHLSNSMAKIMSVVESMKIARFLRSGTPGPSNYNYDILSHNLDGTDAVIYNTNDLESFPDFEGKRNSPFVTLLCGKALYQSKGRSQTDIVTENLMMLLDDSEPSHKKEKSLLWLEIYLRSISTERGRTEQAANWDTFTHEERYRLQLVHDLAHLICLSQNIEPDVEKWNKYHTSLYDILDMFLDDIGKFKLSEPAFLSTLHCLYTAYQIVTMVTDSMKYLSRWSSYSKIRDHLDKKVGEVVERLRKEIIVKSTLIRKSLDESGWMDQVMESIAQGRDHDQIEGTGSEAISNTLERIVPEAFREVWAGDVVASWKDSVDGFSYFKAASS